MAEGKTLAKKRPSWDEYLMDITHFVATMGTTGTLMGCTGLA